MSLKEYQKQHDHYLRQQEALDKHKLLQEEQILRNIIHETQMAKEAQLGELPHDLQLIRPRVIGRSSSSCG